MSVFVLGPVSCLCSVYVSLGGKGRACGLVMQRLDECSWLLIKNQFKWTAKPWGYVVTLCL